MKLVVKITHKLNVYPDLKNEWTSQIRTWILNMCFCKHFTCIVDITKNWDE